MKKGFILEKMSSGYYHLLPVDTVSAHFHYCAFRFDLNKSSPSININVVGSDCVRGDFAHIVNAFYMKNLAYLDLFKIDALNCLGINSILVGGLNKTEAKQILTDFFDAVFSIYGLNSEARKEFLAYCKDNHFKYHLSSRSKHAEGMFSNSEPEEVDELIEPAIPKGPSPW